MSVSFLAEVQEDILLFAQANGFSVGNASNRLRGNSSIPGRIIFELVERSWEQMLSDDWRTGVGQTCFLVYRKACMRATKEQKESLERK